MRKTIGQKTKDRDALALTGDYRRDLGSRVTGTHKEKRNRVSDGLDYDIEGYRALLSPETQASLEVVESGAVDDACADRFDNTKP